MNTKLESILARLPEDVRSGIDVRPLGGGMTNQNFLVERDGETFVLRVFGADTHLLGIDRQRERVCTQIAAQTGIGAEVVPWIPGEDIMVTRFIPGGTLTSEGSAEPVMMGRIVASIRRFHDGPAFPGYFSPYEDIRSYCQQALDRGVSLPDTYPEALARIALIESAIGPVSHPKPCHNDLLAGNLIWDGELIRIIDWEYGAMGDPFFDLGFFAADADLDEARHELLLNHYFGECKRRDLAHLHLMRLVSHLRETFCALLISTISKIDVDYAGYANRRYQQYLSEAAGPRFQEWLEEVS
jgi:thiamine kinase-like enzyme